MDVKNMNTGTSVSCENDNIDTGRRNALARLGLAAAVGYAVPTLLSLTAHASSSDGGSGGDGGGGDSSGDSSGASGSGGDSSGDDSGGGATTPTQPTTPSNSSDDTDSVILTE
jgi:hypothetical protein